MGLPGPGSIPGTGAVNQTTHPSRVGKLAAIIRQLGDHCRILPMLKRVGGKMAGVRTMLPLAQTTCVGFLCVGFLPFAWASFEIALVI